MKKIGNILYKDELVNHEKVDYINYITNGFNAEEIEKLPTLFVGWELIKETYDNLSILNKEIKPNMSYWEFSFNENKSQHVSGVNMFVRNAPYYFFESNYEYYCIDPIRENITNKFDLQQWYDEKTGGIKLDGVYTYKNDMTYILRENTIYGIDHNMWDFLGMEDAAHTFITTTYTSPPENIINDENGDIFAKYNKFFNGYNNIKRYLIVLLSK